MATVSGVPDTEREGWRPGSLRVGVTTVQSTRTPLPLASTEAASTCRGPQENMGTSCHSAPR